MFIEDEELRNIFKTASEEHLQNLDSGLLQLETQADDQAMLELLLREAHSLKGDANMLGVKEIGTLAHQVEHILTQVKQHEISFSQELGDRLAHSVATIHKLVHEAVTGEPADVNSFQVLAELMGGDKETPIDRPEDLQPLAEDQEAVERELVPKTEPECHDNGQVEQFQKHTQEHPLHTQEQPSEQPLAHTDGPPVAFASAPKAAVSVSPSSPQSTASSNSYRIETIRVATRSLDDLMTQAGELTVTKIRIARRLAEIEAIASLWEDWSRDLLNNPFRESPSQPKRINPRTPSHSRVESRLNHIDGLISNLRNALYEDTARLELISDELEEGIRTLRLLPFSTIFTLFPRMVRDLARQEKKQVELVIEGGETCADKRILEEMKDPLLHLLRNAIDHGIESLAERARLGKPATATICLRSYRTPTQIVVEIKDDGRGLDLNRIKQTALKRGICREEDFASLSPTEIQSLIFTPGFSTAPLVTEVSGRGVGLDVVQTNVEKLKGTIEIESVPGQGCLFRIQLSITLATAHVLIVMVNNTPYAVPVEFVRMASMIIPQEIFTLEGRETVVRDNQPVSIVRLADLLELTPDRNSSFIKTNQPEQLICLILQVGREQLGILVDAVIDEQEVVIKPQSKLLKRVRNVSGATILGTGEVCTVLNPQDLIKSVRRRSPSMPLNAVAESGNEKQTILLVEDSIATRTQEKRMLEAAGYVVVTAVDGSDGLNKLLSRSFDAVISDVQMPKLDGLQLTSQIRQHRKYDELPIILVTSLASDDDKRRGAEAGANAYIPKSSLNQDILIETLHRLM